MKKVLCFLLVLIICSSVLISCNGSDTNDNNDDNNENNNEQGINFGGTDYNVLSRQDTIYEIDNSGEGTDDKVQRKIWERNVFIKDTYNANIAVVGTPGTYADRASYVAKAREIIHSGDGSLDLFFAHSSYMQLMAMEGMGVELSKMPQIDLGADWWCENYNDNSEMYGQNYVLVGDMGITLYEYLEVVFFNKSLAEAYQVGDLYALVEEGKWTLDEMMRLSKVVVSDGNTQNENDRIYGLLANSHAFNSFIPSLNLRYTTKGSDGNRQFPTLPQKKMLDTFEKLSAWHLSDAVRYGLYSATDFEESNPIFAKNGALFYTQMLGEAEYMAANMTGNYGVIPYPKLDEGAKYRSTTRDSITASMIPVTSSDLNMAATVTEALCKYGNEYIRYEYFETRLKLRYFDDYQVKAMLDIIVDGLSFEFTQIFGGAMNDRPYGSFSRILEKNIDSPNSETLTNWWRGYYPSWRTSTFEIYNHYKKLSEQTPNT